MDEYSLTVHPIVLGRGKQLFGPAAVTRKLELMESRPPTSKGSLMLRYRPL